MVVNMVPPILRDQVEDTILYKRSHVLIMSCCRRVRPLQLAEECLSTYVGLIPTEDSSGGKQRLGHISKQGSTLLRFLLVEAAQAAARTNPHWRHRYIHPAMRRQKSIAKAAIGRRMAARYALIRRLARVTRCLPSQTRGC